MGYEIPPRESSVRAARAVEIERELGISGVADRTNAEKRQAEPFCGGRDGGRFHIHDVGAQGEQASLLGRGLSDAVDGQQGADSAAAFAPVDRGTNRILHALPLHAYRARDDDLPDLEGRVEAARITGRYDRSRAEPSRNTLDRRSGVFAAGAVCGQKRFALPDSRIRRPSHVKIRTHLVIQGSQLVAIRRHNQQ